MQIPCKYHADIHSTVSPPSMGNPLTAAIFSNPLSPATYVLPVLRREIYNGHITPGHHDQNQQNVHSCMDLYGHKYGQYWCIFVQTWI